MGWRRDEVWFDTDVLWFREQPRTPFGAFGPGRKAPGARHSSTWMCRAAPVMKTGSRRKAQVTRAAAPQSMPAVVLPSLRLVECANS